MISEERLAKNRCMRFEGLSLTRYRDSKGWSIGYGHHYRKRHDCPVTCTPAQAVVWFEQDWQQAKESVLRMLKRREIETPEPSRFHALTELRYMLGRPRFSRFKLTWAAIKRGDWIDVELQLLYRRPPNDVRPTPLVKQSPDRVSKLAAILRTGRGDVPIAGMPVEPERDPGQIAYDAYSEKAGGRSIVSGVKLPTWNGLSPAIKEAWEAAATAVMAQ